MKSSSFIVSAWQTQPEGNLKALMDGHREVLEDMEGRESSSWKKIHHKICNNYFVGNLGKCQKQKMASIYLITKSLNTRRPLATAL